MSQLNQLASELIVDGCIGLAEVSKIRQHVENDGVLDVDDVIFLIELLGRADSVCPEFDAMFLPLMRHVLLKDGKIDAEEQVLLVDMMTARGCIREVERRLLNDLLVESTEVTPEFRKLCEAAFAIPVR
ncbi:MAG: hypothetical protein AAFV88_19735 [Planctomycetota bacterium]